jgi:hypothetical protein
MPISEAAMRAQEILLIQLQQQCDKLRAEVKSKESTLKDLNETARLIEIDCKLKIQAAKEAYEKEKAGLEFAISPLRELKQQCELVKAQLVKLSQDKLDAIANVNTGKNEALREAKVEIDARRSVLAKIETAIATCKANVASL